MPIDPNLKLSDHFALSEFLISQTASRYGIDNTPSEEVLENLKKTALLLERARTILGNRPIFVSSGYRCPDLNHAVGGVAGSAHTFGKAADFVCPGFGPVVNICLTLEGHDDLYYDQLIREYDSDGRGWCHIAWSDTPRRQALTIDRNGARFGIEVA